MVMVLFFDTSNNNNESTQGTKRTLALNVKSKQDSTKGLNNTLS